MSVNDTWGHYPTPCPKCGGKVHYWYFAPDCRGNPGGLGMTCESCGEDFSNAPTGLAENVCPDCSGEVEYQFSRPDPFGETHNPGSRMFCRRCGQDVQTPKKSTPKKKPR